MTCENKKRFNSKAAALDHLRNVIGRIAGRLKQHPYLCPDCRYWHLTTQYD